MSLNGEVTTAVQPPIAFSLSLTGSPQRHERLGVEKQSLKAAPVIIFNFIQQTNERLHLG